MTNCCTGNLPPSFICSKARPDAGVFHHLIGPNLADTLGLKMRKILDKQLALSAHPAAVTLLSQPVRAAQALVKGWLFYQHGEVQAMDGISRDHNHGFWCTAAQVQGGRYVILPKLQWLAPFKGRDVEVFDMVSLQARLADAAQPVLVAAVEQVDGWEVETARGFVVPDDWTKPGGRAAQLKENCRPD